MAMLWRKDREISAARRGQIVQRILVEGWSVAQVASAFDVRERQVLRWVAAYRRHGMASLREAEPAERGPLRWARRLREALIGASLGLRRGLSDGKPAPCITLERTGDRRSGG